MTTYVPQAKNWCFTLNNPDLSEEDVSERLSDATYCVFQLEIGEAGTPHFQGYAMFPNKLRLNTVRSYLPGAHWEVAKGTPQQNREYCTKAETRVGDFVEVGIFPEAAQGKRNDLERLHSRLKEGLTQQDYVDEFFELFVKYPKVVQEYSLARIQARKETDGITVILLYGPPRTGKSRLSNFLAGRHSGGVYRHSLGEWWDGYVGERCVLFDDFCGSSLTFGNFKRTMDRYPLRIPVKGSSCQLAANCFLITTNIDPRHWWKEEVTRGDFAAIFGRITKVLWFTSENHFSLYSSGYDFEKAFYNHTLFNGYNTMEASIPCTAFQVTYPILEEKAMELSQALEFPLSTP